MWGRMVWVGDLIRQARKQGRQAVRSLTTI